MHARIGAECAAVGLPFNPPTHIPNTRLALRAGEVVRARWPDAFAAVDEALFHAVFVTGDDIGDPDTLAEVMSRAGIDGLEAVDAAQRGEGADEVRASIEAAHEVGVTGTPAWLLDDRLLIPGVQERETIERWVARLEARPASG